MRHRVDEDLMKDDLDQTFIKDAENPWVTTG